MPQRMEDIPPYTKDRRRSYGEVIYYISQILAKNVVRLWLLPSVSLSFSIILLIHRSARPAQLRVSLNVFSYYQDKLETILNQIVKLESIKEHKVQTSCVLWRENKQMTSTREKSSSYIQYVSTKWGIREKRKAKFLNWKLYLDELSKLGICTYISYHSKIYLHCHLSHQIWCGSILEVMKREPDVNVLGKNNNLLYGKLIIISFQGCLLAVAFIGKVA